MSFFFPEGCRKSVSLLTDSTFTITVEIYGIGGPEVNKYEEGYIAEVYAKWISIPSGHVDFGTYNYADTTVRLVGNVPKKYLNQYLEIWKRVPDTRNGEYVGILCQDDYKFTPTYTLPAPSSITYAKSINSYNNTTVSWERVIGADKYAIERSTDNGAWASYTTTTGTSYSCGVSSSASSVKFRVKAILITNVIEQESSYTTGSNSSVYYTPPNAAPTVPPSITVPNQIRGGTAIAISWAASSDSDGNLSGYILERASNGGTFEQIYKGSSQSYTDTAGTSWNTVQYRVKAYDTRNASSGYRTGNAVNVIQNAVPVISGTDTNLGVKTGAFSQSYTVTDSDVGQTITVVEKKDGVQKRSFTATSGTQYSFAVTAAEWLEILNGNHTLAIVATDSYGGVATRTYTFSKNETAIEIRLATPLAADDRILRAIMNVTRTIPTGAIFTVEACNNGNDVAPTWIDVTDSILSGSKFFFANTVKTANKWGFDFRIKVQRNSATGDCFIQGVGGNFE